MNGSSVLASAVLAALLVFGGMWALDNTAVGLNIKCRLFRDGGACLLVALTTPTADEGAGSTYEPPATDSPEDRAARQATEEAERRDQAVRHASGELGRAIEE